MKKLPLAVVALLALAACAPGGAKTPPPSPTATTSASAKVTTASPAPTPITASATPTDPSPSPTTVESFPPPPVTESADQAAIRAGWMAYWTAMDKFRKDPTLADLTELTLTTTTGSEEFNSALEKVSKFKERGWKLEGDRIFREIIVSPPVTSSGGPRTSTVSYCHDATGLRVVEVATGQPADVKPIATGLETVTLQESPDGRWQVTQIRNKVAKC